MLEAVGPSRLIARLNQAGAPLVLPKQEAPGLALGLGGIGIRLVDLTMLYTGIARQGSRGATYREPGRQTSRRPSGCSTPSPPGMSAKCCKGTPPPENAAGGHIAFKTGTSYGYRDAWAVGFDGARTIGVWVGRPDGAPVTGLVGRVAAAPILFDAFARLPLGSAAATPAPKGALITTTAKLPPPLQRFSPNRLTGAELTPPVHIVFPPDGSSLELSANDRGIAGSGADQDHRRHAATQRADERHAARHQKKRPHAVLRA